MALFKETLSKVKDNVDWDGYIDSQTKNLAGKGIDLALGGLKAAGQSQSREANQQIAQTQEDMNYQLNKEMRDASSNQEATSIGDVYRGKLFANKKEIDSKVDSTLKENKALWKEGIYYDDNGVAHSGTAEERQELKAKDAATGYYVTPDGKVVKGNRNQQEIGQMRLKNQSLFEKTPHLDKRTGKIKYMTNKEAANYKVIQDKREWDEATLIIEEMAKIPVDQGGITKEQKETLLRNPLEVYNKIAANNEAKVVGDITNSISKETTKVIDNELNSTYKAAFKQAQVKYPKMTINEVGLIRQKAKEYEDKWFWRDLPADEAIQQAIEDVMNSVFK